MSVMKDIDVEKEALKDQEMTELNHFEVAEAAFEFLL